MSLNPMLLARAVPGLARTVPALAAYLRSLWGSER